MPCPQSPEPDGFHRYQLPPSGTQQTAVCRYCGAPRPDTPRPAPHTWQMGAGAVATTRYAASTAKGNRAATAAKRAKGVARNDTGSEG